MPATICGMRTGVISEELLLCWTLLELGIAELLLGTTLLELGIIELLLGGLLLELGTTELLLGGLLLELGATELLDGAAFIVILLQLPVTAVAPVPQFAVTVMPV